VESVKLSQIIEGLSILSKHYDEGGSHISAEHDVLYAYPTDTPLLLTEVAMMKELGWFEEDGGWAALT
jgi:hypothetical protein